LEKKKRKKEGKLEKKIKKYKKEKKREKALWITVVIHNDLGGGNHYSPHHLDIVNIHTQTRCSLRIMERSMDYIILLDEAIWLVKFLFRHVR
jgi:hypothetical protein